MNQSRQIIKEKLDQDEAFKEELKKRNTQNNAQKITSADSKENDEKTVQKMEGIIEEITACRAEKTRAFQIQLRKKKKSAKRAANHRKSEIFGGLPELERDRPKLKIPPLDEGDSSETFYTSPSDSDSDDSIPSIGGSEWEN